MAVRIMVVEDGGYVGCPPWWSMVSNSGVEEEHLRERVEQEALLSIRH